jgi:hypothetical protein
MHSRKSRRALDLDLRTNSLESRRLLATPTATVAMYHRTAVLTKTALVLGPDQYIIGPGPTLSAKVTLTKPLPVHQATGFNFTTSSTGAVTITFAPGSMHTIKAGTKVTFNYGPLQAHLLAKIEARYAAPPPHH